MFRSVSPGTTICPTFDTYGFELLFLGACRGNEPGLYVREGDLADGLFDLGEPAALITAFYYTNGEGGMAEAYRYCMEGGTDLQKDGKKKVSCTQVWFSLASCHWNGA